MAFARQDENREPLDRGHHPEGVEDLKVQVAALESRLALSRGLLKAINHEMRTPMHTLLGFTQLMGIVSDVEANRARRAEYLGYIASAGDALYDRFSELTNFAGLVDESIPLRLDCLDLSEIVAEALSEQRRKGRMRARHLSVADCDPVTIEADRAQIRRLITILLDNAIEHGGGYGEISVHRLAGGGTEIAVRDQGPGVGGASLDDLCRPFGKTPDNCGTRPGFRGASSPETLSFGPAREASGSLGLGLPVARAIMERHGGRLDLVCGEPAGLTVKAIFPG